MKLRSLSVLTLAAWLFGSSSWAAGPEETRPVPVPDSPATAEPSATPVPPESVAPDEEPQDPEPPRSKKRRRGRGGDVRFGSSFKVGADDVHDGDIVRFGGSVTVDGVQRGDIVVFGGSVTVSGEVTGDVVVIGGAIHASDSAHLKGDAVSVGGSLHTADGAVVDGEVVEVGGSSGAFIPALFPAIPMGLGLGALGWSVFGWVKTAVLALLLAVVIAAVIPTRVEAAAHVFRERWLACLLWGFVAFVVSFPLTLLLAITCVGVVLPFVFYQAAKYFGLAVLFAVVGEALARTGLKRDVSLVPAVLLGFLVLSLIGLLAPTWWIYSWLGVGCALITKFGTDQPWIRRGVTPPSIPPVAPPPIE